MGYSICMKRKNIVWPLYQNASFETLEELKILNPDQLIQFKDIYPQNIETYMPKILSLAYNLKSVRDMVMFKLESILKYLPAQESFAKGIINLKDYIDIEVEYYKFSTDDDLHAYQIWSEKSKEFKSYSKIENYEHTLFFTMLDDSFDPRWDDPNSSLFQELKLTLEDQKDDWFGLKRGRELAMHSVNNIKLLSSQIMQDYNIKLEDIPNTFEIDKN